MIKKQVKKIHYQFNKYLKKERWVSIWHQIDEVSKLNPSNVLEIGPGPGIFKYLLNNNGISVETVDIDPDLNPDIVASATKLPLLNNSYDCVCAFQVLEHLNYEDSLKAFNEMVRVSKRYIVISIPNSKTMWSYSIYIPKLGQLNFHIPRPSLRSNVHKFDGQHYWEINKKGYSFNEICRNFNFFKVKLIKSYRVDENPYHHFFLYEKLKN
jgi:ubiquinone/menaquinone biosynthesis C-methylase UbiE